MPYCSILGCKNDSRRVNLTHGGVSYHRFPKNPHLKELWMKATGRQDWFPSASGTICSQHFDTQDITLSKKGINYIRDSAIPTKNVVHFIAAAPDRTFTPESSEIKHEIKNTPGTSRKRSSDVVEESTPAKKVTDHDVANDGVTDLDSSEDNEALEKKLESMLRFEQDKVKRQGLKIKRLRKKYNRMKMTITTMKDMYDVLRDKMKLTDEDIICLETIQVSESELNARRQTNVELSEVVSKLTYTQELRDFALSLHLLSAEAYEYVRKTFKTSLPHPRTLKHWHLQGGGEPGFTREAFVALKRRAGASSEPILAALAIDEICLRRCVTYDPASHKIRGYMNMGTGFETDLLPEADGLLVFMVTALNGHFSVPVAQFNTSGVTAAQCAELVRRGIEMADDAGITIVAVTVGSRQGDVSMLNRLGCDIKLGKVTFEHPVTEEPVVGVVDPSAMLELLVNTLREYDFTDKDGMPIQWKYLKLLTRSYLNEKLKYQFVDYKMERLKLKVSTEPLSGLVANELLDRQGELDFNGSEPTSNFLTVCSGVATIFEEAVDKNNADQIFDSLYAASVYFSELKLNNRCIAVSVYSAHRFEAYISALRLLFERYVDTDLMSCLPIYRLSQHNLKLFFWNLRADDAVEVGDPTATMAVNSYKRVVAEIESLNRSRTPAIEQLSIPRCVSPVKRINQRGLTAASCEDLRAFVKELSDSQEIAVVQVAGHIAQQLIRQVCCDVCTGALVTRNRSVFNLIIAKDRTGFLYPSSDLVRICKVTERFLNGFDREMRGQKARDEVIARVLRQLVDTRIFNEISQHQVGQFPGSNHVSDLMKAVVARCARVYYARRASTFADTIVRLKQMWMKPGPRWTPARSAD